MRFKGSIGSTTRIILACGLVLAGLTACGKSAEKSTDKVQSEKPVAQSPLIGSDRVSDLASLHDTVSARALRGDTLGLLRLMVNDSVYREVVWPVMPAYEPDREEVWNLVMSMHKSNSNKGLRRLMHDIVQPESGDVLRLPLGKTPVVGGILYEIAKTEKTESGIVLFGSALCLEASGCQVLSYAQGGQRGAAGSEAITE